MNKWKYIIVCNHLLLATGCKLAGNSYGRDPCRVTAMLQSCVAGHIDHQLIGMMVANTYSSFELDSFRYIHNFVILMSLREVLASLRYALLCSLAS